MQETEDIVTRLRAYAAMWGREDATGAICTEAATTIATLRAEVEGLRAVLQRILDEPKQTMSDAKALREIVRMARAAIDAAKAG